MKKAKLELLAVFCDECVLPDVIVWEILLMSGLCNTGAYSMFFWVNVS